MSEQRRIDMSDLGLGTVLKQHMLSVPPNQREYSWTEKEVTDLLSDLQRAIDEREDSYFLGTITLTGANKHAPQVTDGQQRLATTMILLTAIRDYFRENDEKWTADWIEREFLSAPDPEEQRDVPRLVLNVDDREFFSKEILSDPSSPARQERPGRRSHERIRKAMQLAREKVSSIVDAYKKTADRTKRLKHWVEYIRDNAVVIVLYLLNNQNAFRMFETLNDRGLKTTQVDILKNYFFEQAGEDKGVVQPKWSRTMGTIEVLDGNDVEMDFLRHFVITKYGMTRSGDVYSKIEANVSGRHRTVEFVTDLESNANDYAAIVQPDHSKWNDYDHHSIRRSIRTLKYLKVVHTRPIMLAATRVFEPREVERAFRLFVNWTVRFLVVGGGRSETLERGYAEAAHEITQRKITDTNGLAAKLLPFVPQDIAFEDAFAAMSVPKTSLARYYLRALELHDKGNAELEWVPNEDARDVNLEHVLPRNPGANWPHISLEVAISMHNRLGNLVLLQTSLNRQVANAGFDIKKPFLRDSTYTLTAMVAAQTQWGPDEIKNRQAALAAIASKAWPLLVT